jgi:hypothetical protein
MWLPTKAKVLYDPIRPGIRKNRPGSLIVANVDPGIAEYYRWWVKKRFGLWLQNTAFIPHVTILDGKNANTPIDMKQWKKFEGQTIDIEYSVDLQQHWKFWVLPVRGNDLQFIRQSIGLAPTYKYHITFGRML